jgi:cytochrome P450
MIRRTIAFAGHETTSTSVTWALYELAKRPEIQDRLRKEIWDKQREKRRYVHHEWDWKDLEEMHYLTAVVKVNEDPLGHVTLTEEISKETLRFHPIVNILFRTASSEDVIPLSEDVVTRHGEQTREIHVPKDTRILISVAAYNR